MQQAPNIHSQNLEIAHRFIAKIANGKTQIPLRTFMGKGLSAKLHQYAISETIEVGQAIPDKLVDANEAQGVYVAVNGVDKDDQFVESSWLFAEIDPADTGHELTDEGIAESKNYQLSVIKRLEEKLDTKLLLVQTRKSFHIYIPLKEPIRNADTWRIWQQRLIQLLGSDRSICNPSRVMRVPGFLHVRGDSETKKPLYAEVSVYQWGEDRPIGEKLLDAVLPPWEFSYWEKEKLNDVSTFTQTLRSEGANFTMMDMAPYLEGFDPNGRTNAATAKCPHHDGESHNSLHIFENGAFICHAGCSASDVWKSAYKEATARGWEKPESVVIPGKGEGVSTAIGKILRTPDKYKREQGLENLRNENYPQIGKREWKALVNEVLEDAQLGDKNDLIYPIDIATEQKINPFSLFDKETASRITCYAVSNHVPVEAVTLPLYGVLSALASPQWTFSEMPHGETTPLISPVKIIGASGAGKTPALNFAIKALEHYQTELEDVYQANHYAWSTSHDEGLEEPVCPVLHINHFTQAGRMAVAENNDGAGFAIIYDELTKFYQTCEGKSSSQDPHLGTAFLSCYTGDKTRSAFKTEDFKAAIPMNFVVIGGIQPEVQDRLRMDDQNDASGLDARFMTARIPFNPNSRKAILLSEEDWLSKPIDYHESNEKYLTKIFHRMREYSGGVVRPCHDGYIELQRYRDTIVERTKRAELSGNAIYGTALKKTHYMVGRLIALTHLFNSAANGTNPYDCVGIETVKSCIAATDYLIAQAYLSSVRLPIQKAYLRAKTTAGFITSEGIRDIFPNLNIVQIGDKLRSFEGVLEVEEMDGIGLVKLNSSPYSDDYELANFSSYFWEALVKSKDESLGKAEIKKVLKQRGLELPYEKVQSYLLENLPVFGYNQRINLNVKEETTTEVEELQQEPVNEIIQEPNWDEYDNDPWGDVDPDVDLTQDDDDQDDKGGNVLCVNPNGPYPLPPSNSVDPSGDVEEPHWDEYDKCYMQEYSSSAVSSDGPKGNRKDLYDCVEETWLVPILKVLDVIGLKRPSGEPKEPKVKLQKMFKIENKKGKALETAVAKNLVRAEENAKTELDFQNEIYPMYLKELADWNESAKLYNNAREWLESLRPNKSATGVAASLMFKECRTAKVMDLLGLEVTDKISKIDAKSIGEKKYLWVDEEKLSPLLDLDYDKAYSPDLDWKPKNPVVPYKDQVKYSLDIETTGLNMPRRENDYLEGQNPLFFDHVLMIGLRRFGLGEGNSIFPDKNIVLVNQAPCFAELVANYIDLVSANADFSESDSDYDFYNAAGRLFIELSTGLDIQPWIDCIYKRIELFATLPRTILQTDAYKELVKKPLHNLLTSTLNTIFIHFLEYYRQVMDQGERAILEEFCTLLQTESVSHSANRIGYKPILGLHNGYEFDLPALKGRIEYHHIHTPQRWTRKARPQRYSAGSNYKKECPQFTVHWVGGYEVIDTMLSASDHQKRLNNIPKFNLKDLSEFILESTGKDKRKRLRLTYLQMLDSWTNDKSTLAEYLVDDLLDTQILLDFWGPDYINFQKIFFMGPSEMHYSSPPKRIESIFKSYYGDQWVTDATPEEKRSYEGGLGSGVPGIYKPDDEHPEGVCCLDFNGFYPSLIDKYGYGGNNDPDGLYVGVIGSLLRESTTLKREIGVLFNQGKEGEAFEKTSTRNTVKIGANGGYGGLSTKGYGFGNSPSAALICASARILLRRMRCEIERLGGFVIEEATDGIKVMPSADNNCGVLLEACQRVLPDGVGIDIEFKGGWLIFSGMKNYAYQTSREKLERGIIKKVGKYKKENSSELRKQELVYGIEFLLNGKSSAEALYMELREDIANGEYPAENLASFRKVAVSETAIINSGIAKAGDKIHLIYGEEERYNTKTLKSGKVSTKKLKSRKQPLLLETVESGEAAYWSEYYLKQLDDYFGEIREMAGVDTDVPF